MRSILLATAVCAAFCVASPVRANGPNVVTVHMRQQSFAPDKAVVRSGSTTLWTNDGTIPHSVAADDGRFDSGPLLPGQSFKWTASSVGNVAYHCIFHPSMKATLTVRQK